MSPVLFLQRNKWHTYDGKEIFTVLNIYIYYPWLTKVSVSTKGQLRCHSSSVSHFADEKTEVQNY